MQRLVDSGPAGRRAVVVTMTRTVLQRVIATAPRDTRRYVRAWAKAGNAAGIGSFSLPPLQKAKRVELFATRLKAQVDRWQRIVTRYESQGRKDKWYNQAKRKLNYAQEQMQKFVDQMAKGGTIIAINAYSAADFKKPVRVLNPEYGGDGQIIETQGTTFVRLHNKEAHASFVERNTKVMRNASSAFRGAGLKQLKGKYVAAVVKRLDG